VRGDSTGGAGRQHGWCGVTARVVWGDSTGGVGRQHGTHNWCHEIRRSLGTTDASEPTEIHTLHFTCFT